MIYRVKYTDKTTGEVMLTGLTTLADATAKAAVLGGEVIKDGENVE